MVTTRINEEIETKREHIAVLDGIKTAATPVTMDGVTGIMVALESGDKMAFVLIPQDVCEEFALGLLAKARKFWGSQVQ